MCESADFVEASIFWLLYSIKQTVAIQPVSEISYAFAAFNRIETKNIICPVVRPNKALFSNCIDYLF